MRLIEIDGADIIPASVLGDDAYNGQPYVLIHGREVDGTPIQLRIVGGSGAVKALAMLGGVVKTVQTESGRAESRRERDLMEQILGNQGGE